MDHLRRAGDFHPPPRCSRRSRRIVDLAWPSRNGNIGERRASVRWTSGNRHGAVRRVDPSPRSPYADHPAERYQFPSQYLKRARALEGCWILYYGPTKSASLRGYYAVAQIADVIRDPTSLGMYVALIAPRTYLEFPRAVPFVEDGSCIERGLLNEFGKVSGRAQQAIRPLDAADFDRILARALDPDREALPRESSHSPFPGLSEPQAFFDEAPRDRVTFLASRPFRDRTFRQLVLQAYDERCAVSGLRLINGGGRAEAEAAHIRPVEADGPDAVSNGLALCGTAHWMFDRGMISISSDHEIILSPFVNDRDGARSMINPTGRLLLPARAEARPHPRYLDWHRENRFKH